MITEISSKEAWVMLREDQSAILVDVRSHAEWMLDGVPVLDSLGKKIICIKWLVLFRIAMDAGIDHFISDRLAKINFPVNIGTLFSCWIH